MPKAYDPTYIAGFTRDIYSQNLGRTRITLRLMRQ